MRATVLSGVREFTSGDLPDPILAEGTAIVRVDAVAICGSDLHGYSGGLSRFGPPTVLGHEMAGTVEAVGAGVTSCREGDRVFIDPILGCGACRGCRAGRPNICPDYRVMGQGLDLPGGLAGRLVAPEANLHVLDEQLTPDVGAVIQPLSVSYHACIDQGRVTTGDTVVVLGAGTIGAGVQLSATAEGARTIMVDPLPFRRQLALRLGAEAVIDPMTENVVDRVRELTDGHGADVVLEAVGGDSDEVLRVAVASTARGGTTVVLGLKLPHGQVPIDEVKEQEKLLIGSQAYPAGTPSVVAERILAGAFPVEELITHRFPVERVDEAFTLLASGAGEVMKIVLEP